MATLDELALLDATAQAELIRSKEVSALELTAQLEAARPWFRRRPILSARR